MTLTISLTPGDIAHIQREQESITVVANFVDTGDFLVVCAAEDAFGSPQLSFGADYQVYAADQQLEAGTILKPEMPYPATPGTLYTLTGTTFENEGLSAYPDNVGIDNQSPSGKDLLCGLEQSYAFNGGTPKFVPTTVTTTPYNQIVYLEQPSSILVFLSNMSAGQLISTDALNPADALASAAAITGEQPLTAADALNSTAAMGSSSLPVVGNYLLVSLAGDATIYFDIDNNCFTEQSPPARAWPSSDAGGGAVLGSNHFLKQHRHLHAAGVHDAQPAGLAPIIGHVDIQAIS